MRYIWIIFVFMTLCVLDYVLMTYNGGTYYEAVYTSNPKSLQEKQTLYHLQEYLHLCSTYSNCNFLAEDKMHRMKMYNTRNEIKSEEVIGIWMKKPRHYIYRLYKEKLSWHGARAKCQLHGGELASITNKQEEDRIKELMSGLVLDKRIWAGLNDIEKEGKYVWSDGSEYSYSNWKKHNPDNYANSEHCIFLTPLMEWYDYVCDRKQFFICKNLLA